MPVAEAIVQKQEPHVGVRAALLLEDTERLRLDELRKEVARRFVRVRVHKGGAVEPGLVLCLPPDFRVDQVLFVAPQDFDHEHQEGVSNGCVLEHSTPAPATCSSSSSSSSSAAVARRPGKTRPAAHRAFPRCTEARCWAPIHGDASPMGWWSRDASTSMGVNPQHARRIRAAAAVTIGPL